MQLDARHVGRAGQEILAEIDVQRLRVVVVDHALEQRIADAVYEVRFPDTAPAVHEERVVLNARRLQRRFRRAQEIGRFAGCRVKEKNVARAAQRLDLALEHVLERKVVRCRREQ